LDLFIAVRDKRLDIYFRGQKLLQLKHSRGVFVGETHPKYLAGGKGTVKSQDGVVQDPTERDKVERYFSFLADLDNIKKVAGLHSPPEKVGTYSFITKRDQKGDLVNPNIIDVEVAFSDGHTSHQIDIAALCRQDSGEYVLRFFEAKRLEDGRLRAESPNYPEVLTEQMPMYEDAISALAPRIKRQYFDGVIEPFIRLKGRFFEQRRPLLTNIKKPDFSVCDKPHLIIFGFDEPQRQEWQASSHRTKLVSILGENRIKERGNPAGIKIRC
jgi:hypothetical protein